MIPLNGAGKYKQGVYKPIYPEKYVGKGPILYRSAMELKLFLFLDKNKNVITWNSEGVIIPYLNPLTNKVSRYYVDGFVSIKEGSEVKNYLIEVKPKKQTKPPEFTARQKEKTKVYETKMWLQNQAKWEATKKWLNEYNQRNKTNLQFMILTEEHLK